MNKTQTTILIKVTTKEAALLKELRKYPFGQFTVHKMDGLLVRFEARESKLLNEEDGMELKVDERLMFG